jgi:hypothetical protein
LGLNETDALLALAAVAVSAAWLVAAAIAFALRRPPEPPVGPRTLELGPEPPAVVGAVFIVPCAAVLVGIALTVMAYADLRSKLEVTGPILRLRVLGGEKTPRYYVAVDDGLSHKVRAWRVNPRHYLGPHPGRDRHRGDHQESRVCALDHPQPGSDLTSD